LSRHGFDLRASSDQNGNSGALQTPGNHRSSSSSACWDCAAADINSSSILHLSLDHCAGTTNNAARHRRCARRRVEAHRGGAVPRRRLYRRSYGYRSGEPELAIYTRTSSPLRGAHAARHRPVLFEHRDTLRDSTSPVGRNCRGGGRCSSVVMPAYARTGWI